MKKNEEALTWDNFLKVDMRVGTIISAEFFKEARNPSYKLVVDFGEYGHKKTAAQLTTQYNTENLNGMQVIAVINFPPKQIANFMSECLILGAVEEKNLVTLLQPERPVENGTKIG